MAIYPAIDVRSGPADVIPAIVDDFRPTAIEERADAVRVFFTDTRLRDAAGAALSAANYTVQPLDVDDEDWARRSQENLKPITVGRITIVPSSAMARRQTGPGRLKPAATDSIVIVIQPSMGFGTGHHATTRLCLRALQAVDLADRFVLDVGTGSGVLAIAAVKLGAARAAGIDDDADAIHAANESLHLNSGVESVEFQLADLSAGDLPQADVVTANLTGALLIRSAARLLGLVLPGGILVVSGLLDEERDDVVRAFGDAGAGTAGPNKVRPTPDGVGKVRPDVEGEVAPPTLLWEHHEDGWAALAMKRS